MQLLLPKSRRLPIQSKLVSLFALIGIGIIAFLVFFYYSFSATLQEEKKSQSKDLSESALGVIQYFHHLALSGHLTSSDAQRYAINALKMANYGDNGYFWIISDDGESIMNPNSQKIVEANLLTWADDNGKYFVQQSVKKAKEGGGWVSYYWPKPNLKEEYPKVSYVTYFTPWNWILGTGLYFDEMQEAVFWVVIKASGFLIISFLVFIATLMSVVNYFVLQLSDLAVRDALTNLYTKRFLQEITPSILRKHQRLNNHTLASIFMDIDHFKKINDNYGHDWGDKVIKQIATVITNNIRPDDYCIRYGGEEFVIVGFFDNETSVKKAAERIREKVSQLTFSEGDTEFKVTLSGGIAFHDSSKESFNDTLIRADNKLYLSKKAGRNCISI